MKWRLNTKIDNLEKRIDDHYSRTLDNNYAIANLEAALAKLIRRTDAYVAPTGYNRSMTDKEVIRTFLAKNT